MEIELAEPRGKRVTLCGLAGWLVAFGSVRESVRCSNISERRNKGG